MKKHDLSIELLRGAAAMAVMLTHYQNLISQESAILAFSFTGVDLFFVISGYVFAPTIFSALRAEEIFPFFIRRFFRIYPLFIVSFLLYAFLHYKNDIEIKYLFEHITLTHTFVGYESAFYYNPAYWSLPPEIEFYLLIPLFSAFFFNKKIALLFCFLSAICHFSIAYNLPELTTEINKFSIASVHIPGLLIEFFLGSLVWLLHQKKTPTKGIRVASVLAGAGVWLAAAYIFTSLGSQSIHQIHLLRGNLGVIAALTFSAICYGLIGTIKSPRPWVRNVIIIIGNSSYGIYLFHNASPKIIDLFKMQLSSNQILLLSIAITIIMSLALHYTIEAPARKLGIRLSNALRMKFHKNLVLIN